ncbi:peptide-binding protein [Trinickia dinghuensis]|uniref:Peptide-binding protein n=2 Tax=Trinickia dinghuensis TaxID=2291023 RepID=A0A3D8K3G5_9BURK|nr:peptide-binding protein [Trinickia dinghuensis]
MAGALCAAAACAVHAQPPHGHRGGFAAAAPHVRQAWRAPNRPMAGMAPRQGSRSFVMATDPYGHGGAHMVPAPAIAPATVPFRPVSEEARTLAREGGAAYLRAGSIRADIARYNEEREANRPVPRPPNAGVPRPPQSSLYRN